MNKGGKYVFKKIKESDGYLSNVLYKMYHFYVGIVSNFY